MSWLFRDLPAWADILFGFTLLFVGLFLEDWIDRWRGRQRDGWVDRTAQELSERGRDGVR